MGANSYEHLVCLAEALYPLNRGFTIQKDTKAAAWSVEMGLYSRYVDWLGSSLVSARMIH